MPGEILQLPIDDLVPGRYQPRQHVREESIAELADSIREQGVLQPLIVRRVRGEARDGSRGKARGDLDGEARDAGGDPRDAGGDPRDVSGFDNARAGADANSYYEIVAGERRWRAARLAGFATVPVIVRDLSDQSALAVALIENLQREDLNPIDQARSMAQLVEEFALTHEEIAKALGRSRASVTNFLRLLDLADDVKASIVNGTLDMGHARALLPLDPEAQVALARKIERLGWSVRQVEKAVKTRLEAPPSPPPGKTVVDLQTRWLANQLAREIGEKIAIRGDGRGDYVLQVGFSDLANLEATLERLQDLVEQIRAAAGPRARERAAPDATG